MGERENGRAGGDTRGVRERQHGRPTKIVSTRKCGYFQLVERLSREKVIARGEKTVNQ